MRNPGFTILLLIAGLGWWFMTAGGTPGTVDASGKLLFPGYQVAPLERYEIEARVLSRRNYRLGREADLSPVDLALGWGPMADPAVLSAFEISQRNRWYFWRSAEQPISSGEVVASSANVHIIPATDEVARQLDDIGKGDQVRLHGQLVEVTASDGWRWRSSLSRTDTGNGSCELLLLDRITLI